MKKEESALLNQLALSLEETVNKLDKAYQGENTEEFDRLRKLFFQNQEKIEGALK